MERWYIALEARQNPEDLYKRFRQMLKNYGLMQLVSRVCYERGAGTNKRSAYYFFVGLDTEQVGHIPSKERKGLYEILSALKLHGEGIYVQPEDIKKMAGNEIEGFNFRQVKVASLPKSSPQDPFAKTDNVKPSTTGSSENYNRLLYWLSATQNGTWQQFRATCAALGLDPDGEQSRRIARRLRTLGHLELLRQGQTWFVAPPTLVMLQQENHGLVCCLVGQRSPQLINLFQTNGATVSSVPQASGDAPDVVEICFESELEIQNIIDDICKQTGLDIRYVGFAALNMAFELPNLAEWQASLPTLYIQEGRYDFRQLRGSNFEPVSRVRETGLYQLTPFRRNEDAPLTLFYDATLGKWYKGDWYGLRYLALQQQEDLVEAEYDEKRQMLCVPSDQRWPELYERALVLASGRLPVRKHGMLMFSNISAVLADNLTHKVQAQVAKYGRI